MRIKRIALFFLVIFSIFLVAPTAIKIIEKKVDISYFISLSEEENKNSLKELNPDKIFIIHTRSAAEFGLLKNKSNIFTYLDNHYPKVFIDSNYPPPEEHNII